MHVELIEIRIKKGKKTKNTLKEKKGRGIYIIEPTTQGED